MVRMLLVAAVMGGLGFAVGLAVRRDAPADPRASLRASVQPTVEISPVSAQPPADTAPHAWRRSGSELVRPLMGCEPSADGALEALRAPVEAVIEAARAQGTVERVGVYVHTLTSAHSLEIDADGLFAPASLGKVPLLMALLRTEEEHRGTLDTPVHYPEWLRRNDKQAIRPEAMVTPGQSWTLNQLAQAMIVESDNNATFLINSEVDTALLDQTYADLGWYERPFRVYGEKEMGTTPRVIGRVFRTLHDATYLGEGTSDMALRLLTRTRMHDGLVAGVPRGVVVAHKFGEWTTYTADGSSAHQFHDCGIVYRPGRPYVACVMTLGPSAFQRPLIELVAEISRALWSGFDGLPTSR